MGELIDPEAIRQQAEALRALTLDELVAFQRDEYKRVGIAESPSSIFQRECEIRENRRLENGEWNAGRLSLSDSPHQKSDLLVPAQELDTPTGQTAVFIAKLRLAGHVSRMGEVTVGLDHQGEVARATFHGDHKGTAVTMLELYQVYRPAAQEPDRYEYLAWAYAGLSRAHVHP